MSLPDSNRRQVLKAMLATPSVFVSTPSSGNASQFRDIYREAKKEGALTLYGGGPAFWYTDWAQQFEATFPGIRVDFVGGFSNQLTPQIDRQIANKAIAVDIAVLQTLQDFDRWKNADSLSPLPHDALAPINIHFRDSDGFFTGVSVYTLSYAYHVQGGGAPPPAKASDFLEPAYIGQAITVYPQTDDVTLFLYWTIVQKYGWEWMHAYAAHQPAFVKGHLGVAQAIADGGKLVTFDTITELSAVQPGYGTSSRVLISDVDALPYWPQSMAIFRECPHPHAAELFLRWSLGREQQFKLNRKGVWSVRDDVAPPDGFKPLSNYTLARGYREFVNDAKRLADLREKFESIIGPPVGVDVR